MTIRGNSALDVETRIRARPETVFAFFTQPDAYRRWMGERAELDPRPGGLYRVHMPDGAVAEGSFLRVEPPDRLAFTWGWVGSTELPPGSTTVEVTLRQEGDLTVLRLTHTGLPTRDAREQHALGWRHFLDRLGVTSVEADPGVDPIGGT